MVFKYFRYLSFLNLIKFLSLNIFFYNLICSRVVNNKKVRLIFFVCLFLVLIFNILCFLFWDNCSGFIFCMYVEERVERGGGGF